MRKVLYKIRTKPDGQWKTDVYEGVWHAWGHYQDGDSQYPVGIIEKIDGAMITVCADDIQFIEGWRERELRLEKILDLKMNQVKGISDVLKKAGF